MSGKFFIGQVIHIFGDKTLDIALKKVENSLMEGVKRVHQGIALIRRVTWM
jgi:hypothetical protein